MNRTLTHEFKNQWSWTSILLMTGLVWLEQTFPPVPNAHVIIYRPPTFNNDELFTTYAEQDKKTYSLTLDTSGWNLVELFYVFLGLLFRNFIREVCFCARISPFVLLFKWYSGLLRLKRNTLMLRIVYSNRMNLIIPFHMLLIWNDFCEGIFPRRHKFHSSEVIVWKHVYINVPFYNLYYKYK